jgi:hypothetical protein
MLKVGVTDFLQHADIWQYIVKFLASSMQVVKRHQAKSAI